MELIKMNAYHILIELQRQKGHAMTARTLKPFVYPNNVETVRKTVRYLQEVGVPVIDTGLAQGSWALLDDK